MPMIRTVAANIKRIFKIKALVRPLKFTKRGMVVKRSASGILRVRPLPWQLRQEEMVDPELLATPKPSQSGQRSKYFSNWAEKSTPLV